MRRILIASLLLSPTLFIAPAVASQPRSDADTSTQPLQVSTGVVAPQLIHSAIVDLPDDSSGRLNTQDTKVVLSLEVDARGKTQNIQVIKSVNPGLEERVVDAVRQFRYRPAKLDNQDIPLDMNLTVDLHN
jgi:TonB family protein